MGSLAAIPLTAAVGFSNALLLGGGAYALAWLVVELPFPEQWLDVTRR